MCFDFQFSSTRSVIGGPLRDSAHDKDTDFSRGFGSVGNYAWVQFRDAGSFLTGVSTSRSLRSRDSQGSAPATSMALAVSSVASVGSYAWVQSQGSAPAL